MGRRPNETRSKFLDAISREMPPMHHSIPGQEFSMERSEVICWIMQQPETMEYVWNNIKNSGAVIYDRATGMWRGSDYGD